MKKALTAVAALGLIVGLAPTASAVEFKISGKYLLEDAYLSAARRRCLGQSGQGQYCQQG